MTSIANYRTEFGGITGMGGPLPVPLIAVAGPRHTILHATKSGGQVVLLGESADLGAETLAVENSSSPNFHVLTTAGVTRVSDDDSPQIVSTHPFNPGGGRWLALFGSFLVTPLANGGVQVINATTGAQISQLPSIVQDSRFAYGYADNNVVYVVDGKAASICVLKVTAAGVLQFVGRVRAPNCREIVKVVLDENTNGNLFVVCRRRIVRFTVPLSAVTDDDDLLPTFEEDYGVATADYTDLVVVGDNKYWIGQDSVDAATPLDAFYGPMLGVWNAALGDNGELFVAAPRGSIWTVNNVVPYFEEDEIEDTIDVPPVIDPPVVTPEPPVITSALTDTTPEDSPWTYTITATGTGPITFGVTSPPAWLTSINPLTGVISGTPPDVETVNLTITATNDGGTDSETLVLTVVSAVGDNTGVYTNGQIQAMDVDESTGAILVYMAGGFTQVTDSSGTYTRNRAACLNVTTGLWTAWNPNCSSTNYRAVCVSPDGFVYISSTSGSMTIGGQTRTYVGRVDPTTGAVDSWAPSFDAQVNSMDAADSGEVYMVGSFNVVDGNARESTCSFLSGSLTAWKVKNSLGEAVRSSGGSDNAANIQSVRVLGSLVYCGGSNLRLDVDNSNAALGFMGRNYVIADATTGDAIQCSRGLNNANGISNNSLSTGVNGVIAVCIQGPQIWPELPLSLLPADPTTWSPMISTGGNVSFGFAPDIDAGSSPRTTTQSDDGDIFISGDIVGIGGDATLKGVGKFSPSGVYDTGFSFSARGNATWQASAQSVNVLGSCTAGVIIVGGSFDSGGADTYDGDRADNILVINQSDGARR